MNLVEPAADWPRGESEVAALLRALDWTSSPLGPPATWPDRLRAVAELVLASPLVSTLACGPARVLLYNDAAARLYGDRHPDVLGRPLAEAFPDSCPAVTPFYARTFAGESLHVPAEPVNVSRDGCEVFDAHLTPVRDEAGQVLAVHMVGFEVAARVAAEAALRQRENRQAFLLRLADALTAARPGPIGPGGDPTLRGDAAMRVVANHLGVARALYLEVDGDEVTVARAHSTYPAPTPLRRHVSDFGRAVRAGYAQGRGVAFRDVEEDPRLDSTERAAFGAMSARSGASVPVRKGGRLVAVLALDHPEPRPWAKDELRLLGEVAERAWAATERARAEASLREGEERGAFLLRLSDALRPLSDPHAVRGVAARLVAERLGVARALYAELGEDGAVAALDAHPAGSVPPPRRLSDLGPHVEGCREGRTFAFADAETDARLYARARAWARAAGLRAGAAVPVLGDDRLLAVLAIAHPRPRPWLPGELLLLQEVAERTQAAAKRARAEGALRDSEERFRRFAATASDVLWIRDARTLRFEYVSPAFEAVYGDRFEHVLAGNDLKRWARLILPEDHRGVLDAFRRVRAGERVTHEFRIRRPSDGHLRWIRDTTFPLRDEAGRVRRVAGIGHDATDEKRAAERQQALVAELRHRSRDLLDVVRPAATLKTSPAVPGRRQGPPGRFYGDQVELEAVVRAEVAAHVEPEPPKVTLRGPRVALTIDQAQAVALACHGLAADAARHGALREAGGAGRLAVTWVVAHGGKAGSKGGGARLVLDWIESGARVRPGEARRKGEREAIAEDPAAAPRASVACRSGPNGLRCRVELPLEVPR